MFKDMFITWEVIVFLPMQAERNIHNRKADAGNTDPLGS
jgi:hypothetical protein